MADVEIWKPSPLPSVHFTPAVEDAHVKGPSVIDCPYCNVGVSTPALDRHWPPVHSVKLPSFSRLADLGGEIVRHNVDVNELGPKL